MYIVVHLDVAEVLGIEFLHDQRSVLLRLLLQLRQLVCRGTQDYQLNPQKSSILHNLDKCITYIVNLHKTHLLHFLPRYSPILIRINPAAKTKIRQVLIKENLQENDILALLTCQKKFAIWHQNSDPRFAPRNRASPPS